MDEKRTINTIGIIVETEDQRRVLVNYIKNVAKIKADLNLLKVKPLPVVIFFENLENCPVSYASLEFVKFHLRFYKDTIFFKPVDLFKWRI